MNPDLLWLLLTCYFGTAFILVGCARKLRWRLRYQLLIGTLWPAWALGLFLVWLWYRPRSRPRAR